MKHFLVPLNAFEFWPFLVPNWSTFEPENFLSAMTANGMFQCSRSPFTAGHYIIVGKRCERWSAYKTVTCKYEDVIKETCSCASMTFPLKIFLRKSYCASSQTQFYLIFLLFFKRWAAWINFLIRTSRSNRDLEEEIVGNTDMIDKHHFVQKIVKMILVISLMIEVEEVITVATDYGENASTLGLWAGKFLSCIVRELKWLYKVRFQIVMTYLEFSKWCHLSTSFLLTFCTCVLFSISFLHFCNFLSVFCFVEIC